MSQVCWHECNGLGSQEMTIVTPQQLPPSPLAKSWPSNGVPVSSLAPLACTQHISWRSLFRTYQLMLLPCSKSFHSSHLTQNKSQSLIMAHKILPNHHLPDPISCFLPASWPLQCTPGPLNLLCLCLDCSHHRWFRASLAHCLQLLNVTFSWRPFLDIPPIFQPRFPFTCFIFPPSTYLHLHYYTTFSVLSVLTSPIWL